jgi:16S rRNA (guanine966-N2)-methyltransferase
MHLRITGGRLRGKKLHSVPGLLTRPTASRVRESVFNILSFDVEETRVLDLFAGSGVLGLEALSRGARFALFIDHHRQPVSVIQKNISSCGLDADTRVIRYNLQHEFSWAPAHGSGFQLVFMDPPYNRGFINSTLARLHAAGLLEHDAIVVVEHSAMEPIVEEEMPFALRDQRSYGKTLVSFLLYAAESCG